MNTMASHLADFLRQLDARGSLYVHQFIHTTQRWLSLAGDKVGAYSKDINLVCLHFGFVSNQRIGGGGGEGGNVLVH